MKWKRESSKKEIKKITTTIKMIVNGSIVPTDVTSPIIYNIQADDELKNIILTEEDKSSWFRLSK